LVVAAKFLVAATKKLFVVPNFVAVQNHFFRDGFNSWTLFLKKIFQSYKVKYRFVR